jgi:hypothetical protein
LLSQASFSIQLRQLYDSLSTCIKDFHQPQLTVKHLKSVDKIVRESSALAKLQPDTFFAQLQLPKKQYTFRVNLTFNCLCLTLLLGKLHRWNESSLHQLLCSAITSFVHQQALLEKSYQGNKSSFFSKLNQGNARLAKLTELTKQKIWHSGSIHEQGVHGLAAIEQIKLLDKIPLERQILFISRWLSIQVTPSKRVPIQAFASVVQKLTLILPSRCYALISPLMKYPSLCAPGSIVRSNKGLPYWVLSQSDGKLVVKSYDRTARQSGSDSELLNTDTLTKVHLPKIMGNFNVIDELWDSNWKETYSDLSSFNKIVSINYRVDKPPALLMAIQDQLQKPEVDIDRVCQLVMREPTFSQYLQLTASKNSRQQLPVDNVKHAIMIHGLGRAQSILTQQALMLRLTQNTFPLLMTLNQFTSLARAFSEHIADQVTLFLPEEASTFISFVCASLYTDVRFKRMILGAGEAKLELRVLLTPNLNPLFLEHAKKLCLTWQQDPVSINTIGYMHSGSTKKRASKQVKTLSAITQLSLAMTRLHILPYAEEDLILSNQMRESLSINESRFKEIQVSATSTLFSSLHN